MDKSSQFTKSSQETLVSVSSKKKRVWCQKARRNILAIAIVILAALAFIFLITTAVLGSRYVCKTSPCISDECINSARELERSIDFRVHPCDDFYHFTCGKFAESHPLRHDNQFSQSWFSETADEIDNELIRLLQNNITKNPNEEPKIVKCLKNLFSACIDTERLDQLGLRPLFEVLEAVELTVPFPSETSNFDLTRTLALLQKILGMDILILLSVYRGDENITGITIHFDQPRIPSNPLPSIHRDNEYRRAQSDLKDNEKLISNIKYMSRVIQYIGSWNKTEEQSSHTTTDVANIAVKVLLFKTELKKKKRQESYSEPVLKTLQEIQQMWDTEAPNAEKANKVNWTLYMEILVKDVNISFNVSETPVLIGNIPYFKFLAKFLESTKPEIIEWYVWWELVSILVPHTDRTMRKHYNMWYMEMYNAIKYLRRSERCLEAVKTFLPWTVSYLMISESSIPDILNEVEDMMDEIRESFITLVKNKKWINKETKSEALAKAEAVTMYFGYPEWLLDPKKLDSYYEKMIFEEEDYLWGMIKLRSGLITEILEQIGRNHTDDLDEWEGTYSYEVNAFYSETSNSIIVPAGILRFPFFNLGLKSMNYGALGYLLGHELTHGFDTNGRKRDKYGRERSWWSESMEREYENRSNCFVNQYSGFSIKGHQVNGNMTLAENIADNGGIHETVEAYHTYRNSYGEESRLVGLEAYTQEQLLFISFAHMWCHTPGKNYGKFLRDDEHSPKEFRVIGTLQNLKRFAEVWNCPIGSPMNPENKCSIW